MSKPTVYLETSIIGYATSWPSRDLVVAARQQVTREWLDDAPKHYDLYVSPVVYREAMSGDQVAAEERLELIRSFAVLELTEPAKHLASSLVRSSALPRKADEDAFHIAVAAVNGIQYLLTWNLKHIANATMRSTIDQVCVDAGYDPPVICIPDELPNEP